MPIPLALVGGALAAAGSVGSSFISGSQARKNWREQAEYNTPVNQVSRLRAAGINPAFAMQQGMMDSGAVSSPADAPPPFDVNQLAGSVRDSIQLQQQNDLNKANINNIQANTLGQNIRNKTQLIRDLAEFSKIIADAKQSGMNTEYLEKQRDLCQKQIDNYDDLVSGQIRSSNAVAEFNEEKAATERVMRGVNKKLAEEGIKLSKAQQALMAEEAKSVRETVKQMVMNGVSQREINSFIRDKERETARKLHFENENWYTQFETDINESKSRTSKNNREHMRQTFSFFGVPLGTRESIVDYNAPYPQLQLFLH